MIKHQNLYGHVDLSRQKRSLCECHLKRRCYTAFVRMAAFFGPAQKVRTMTHDYFRKNSYFYIYWKGGGDESGVGDGEQQRP